MSATGIQGFWNYDAFSLLGPSAGRPQSEAIGFINNFTQNLCFTQTDITLKCHNNPPILTRTYNSHNQDEDIVFNHGGVTGASFIGVDWMLNFEHCLLKEDDGENPDIYEIDPTGCRNVYSWGGSNYDSPKGVFKDLIEDGSDLELVTRDYFTYHFSEKNNRTNMAGTFYGLDYIEDRNGVRVVVV